MFNSKVKMLYFVILKSAIIYCLKLDILLQRRLRIGQSDPALQQASSQQLLACKTVTEDGS